MSDNNLRLQVILNAVDKLTRPFRSAQASSRELAAAVKKSRDAIKQLDQAGSSLDSFRKLQAENQGSDSNLLIVFYVQIMPDDLVMQLHR
ncbi:hypothetical protein P2R34_19305, partial [Escherichia coli]